jgi:DNA helicase-2/ATP-dependent DNA helicase PcrA
LKLVLLFEQKPDVCDRYQQKFQYILIDEYQDTNRCQYVLAKTLAARHRNICGTGDPDQSIYTWRGADIQNILDFEKDYPDAKVVKLEQNYRSTKHILHVASELIKRNVLRKEKTLWTNKAEGAKVQLIECEDEVEEAEAVAGRIAELRAEGMKCRDFAVFYRVNAQSRTFEAALRNRTIPYTIVGGVEFYQRREVKDILAYLRLMVNPSDGVSFDRIVNVPPRGVGEASLERLKQWALTNKVSLLAAARNPEKVEGLHGRAVKGLQDLKTVFDDLSKLPHSPVAEVVKAAINAVKYEDYLKLEGPQGEERMENVEELVSAAAEYDARSPDGSTAGFLEEVALIADVDTWDARANAVTLMTLHSAKGLEFPVVFITGLEEGLLPHERGMTEGAELEEERRLCYVGITRAKQALMMTRARARTRFGLRSASIPSRFLSEIPSSAVERIERVGIGVRRDDEEEKPSAYWSAQEEEEDGLRPGDTVQHPQLGVGYVVALSGWGEDRRARVKFRTAGEKTLVLKHAKLEKL